MPRKSGKIPSYCHHKASGRAVTRIDGRDHYLGTFGSPQSHERYERLIAEWRLRREHGAEKQPGPASIAATEQFKVKDLLLRYMAFAETYYVDAAGRPTHELKQMKYALRPLRKLYGGTLVRDFGPLALKAVRQHMIDDEDLSRGVTNHRTNRIRRVFKWAVSEELAPARTYEAIRAVDGLRLGRTKARETEPVRPAPQAAVDAVVEVVSPQVAAMIQVQQLAAMRPCEVVAMRASALDMSGDIWMYELCEHKNRWRGYDRHIPLGPRAQAILKPFLSLSTTAYLFSPRAAEEWRNDKRARDRKTPMTPSQAKRKLIRKKPKRPKGDHYSVPAYARAIKYGIRKVNRQREKENRPPIPHWCPLQLRHSRATEIRKHYGIEAAQVVLGHARADVTQVYAERNLDAAIRIARETG